MNESNPLRALVTLLGTGTSAGVPLIHCTCPVCTSFNPHNRRLRTSAWIRGVEGSSSFPSFLIDTSIDLRQQALHYRIPRVNAVLYTHPHADHLYGIDELRAYNFVQEATIPVYGNAWTERELENRFSYAFKNQRNQNLPDLKFHRIETEWPVFEALGIPIVPLSLEHGREESVGYRMGSFAYLTDCHNIPERTWSRLKNLEVLVIDCVRYRPHQTHFHLERSLEAIARIQPRQAYLTHLSHEMDADRLPSELPSGVAPAFDGLTFEIVLDKSVGTS